MEDHNNNLDQLTLRLDDSEELNALTLTTLLNSGVEEALSNLSPAQLIQLEKNVQKLKRQKTTTTTITPLRTPKSSSGTSSRKRRLSDPDSLSSVEHRPRPTGGQYMNLPASTPQIEYRDGIEWLAFTYSTKGHIQEYCIRVDIDDLSLDEIPDDFKAENCVYPRALVPREAYVGNRWEYETSVNELSWKLTWRNPGVLCGKRGLIQRAVDSYRNRTPENRSRRVQRQEKLVHGVFKKKDDDDDASVHDSPALRVPGPKTLTLQVAGKEDEMHKIKIRVDIEGVDMSQFDDDFKRNNAIYPLALEEKETYSGSRWEYENACNELAWKLAWLNSQRLAGNHSLLLKAVDSYHARMEAADRARRSILRQHQQQQQHGERRLDGDSYQHRHHSGLDDALLDKNEEFSQMVAHTLQQALSHHGDLEADDMHYHNEHDDLDEEEDHPQTVSTAELLGRLI